MLLLQCLAQQILISVVLKMQWSLEAQKSHVAVMEHGVLRILCVNASLDIVMGGQSVLLLRLQEMKMNDVQVLKIPQLILTL
jgi:hypothetical protein